MKFYAINGSPRTNWNTYKLLEHALKGITDSIDEPVETEIINLYNPNYKGCISCFNCKLKDGKFYGKCAMKDDLTPILEKLSQADGIIMGSPIYIGDVTGQFRSFIERLIFPYYQYTIPRQSLAPKKMPTALIFNMNLDEKTTTELGYDYIYKMLSFFNETIFTKPEILKVYNTYQFNDYSKYKVEAFSEEDKRKYKEEHFPIDCKNAYNLGRIIANKIKN
jgi:multimeric flavodoxin WrbA